MIQGGNYCKMLKKIMKTFLALACILLITTGCSNGFKAKNNSNGSKKIAVLIHTTDNDMINKLLSSIKKHASQNGMSVDIYDSENDNEKQIKQLKSIAKKNYAAIMVRPVEASNAQELIAIAGKTPVVFYNFQPEKNVLKANQDIYVGPEEEMAGRLQAEYVLSHTNKQTLNVVILRGPDGLVAEKRTDAFKKTLEKSGRKINYVFNDTANWEEDTAEHQMELFLRTGKPCDVIASNNDNMALGALKAFKKAHRKLPIACGVDVSDDGKKALEKGELGISVAQTTDIQGQRCIEAIMHLIDGKKISDIKGSTEDELYVYTNMISVTRQNVSDY